MDLGMALAADREQVARKFLKNTDIREVVNLSRCALPAFLAHAVGALQNVLASLAPEGRAEIPVIRGRAIEGFGHVVILR
jgi:hypothetical protein